MPSPRKRSRAERDDEDEDEDEEMTQAEGDGGGGSGGPPGGGGEHLFSFACLDQHLLKLTRAFQTLLATMILDLRCHLPRQRRSGESFRTRSSTSPPFRHPHVIQNP